MQMSRKTVGIIALALAVIMLIPALAFAKPVWFTKSEDKVFTINQTNFDGTITKNMFTDKTFGKILQRDHVFTGEISDYRELYICLDTHKIMPFDPSISEFSISFVDEKYEDRIISSMPRSLTSMTTDKDKAEMGFILYTAGMTDAEMHQMADSIEICVKWKFTPGITGADYIKLA